MLLLQPIPVQPHGPMDNTFQRLHRTTSPQHFYHRTPPPTLEELRFFGLQTANEAHSQVLCPICQGRVRDPVETNCNHIFCFGCIYEWFGTSSSCPHCESDLYHTRKLRKQPSRDIHPADRDVPHRFSSSEWIRATNIPTTKSFKQQTPRSNDSQLSVQKPRQPRTYLEVPKVSHQHTPSDRAASYQHRKVSFHPDTRRGKIKCGRYSLPSYGTIGCDKSQSTPYQQYSLERCEGDLSVQQPQEENEVEIMEHLDPTMIDLISTCTEYLEREQQAAEQNIRIMCIDPEDILENMWTANNSLGKDVSVPIRCRAIAKCVWREWENYLRSRDGRLIVDEELFWGLHASFEQTVVEYGWVSNWRELPADFVDLLERTMAAGTQA